MIFGSGAGQNCSPRADPTARKYTTRPTLSCLFLHTTHHISKHSIRPNNPNTAQRTTILTCTWPSRLGGSQFPPSVNIYPIRLIIPSTVSPRASTRQAAIQVRATPSRKQPSTPSPFSSSAPQVTPFRISSCPNSPSHQAAPAVAHSSQLAFVEQGMATRR